MRARKQWPDLIDFEKADVVVKLPTSWVQLWPWSEYRA